MTVLLVIIFMAFGIGAVAGDEEAAGPAAASTTHAAQPASATRSSATAACGSSGTATAQCATRSLKLKRGPLALELHAPNWLPANGLHPAARRVVRGPPSDARPPPGGFGWVVLGRVDGAWVAHPAGPGTRADGLGDGGIQPPIGYFNCAGQICPPSEFYSNPL